MIIEHNVDVSPENCWVVNIIFTYKNVSGNCKGGHHAKDPCEEERIIFEWSHVTVWTKFVWFTVGLRAGILANAVTRLHITYVWYGILFHCPAEDC
jgi:hypothetical protein